MLGKTQAFYSVQLYKPGLSLLTAVIVYWGIFDIFVSFSLLSMCTLINSIVLSPPHPHISHTPFLSSFDMQTEHILDLRLGPSQLYLCSWHFSAPPPSEMPFLSVPNSENWGKKPSTFWVPSEMLSFLRNLYFPLHDPSPTCLGNFNVINHFISYFINSFMKIQMLNCSLGAVRCFYRVNDV